MKKIIYLLLIGFIHEQCSAQTKLTPGEIKGKHDTFVIHLLKPVGMDTNKLLVIYSKSNKYNNGVPYPKREKNKPFIPIDVKRDIHINDVAVKQIIYQALTNKLAALNQNKEIIRVIFDFKPEGNITDIIFSLHGNTMIDLQDIEKIDQQLRANIRATFTRKEYLQYEVINYVEPQIIF
jgi:hypothetical protein